MSYSTVWAYGRTVMHVCSGGSRISTTNYRTTVTTVSHFKEWDTFLLAPYYYW